MKQGDLQKLKIGDIITNIGSGNSYIVSDYCGENSVVAIRTIIVTNPPEWRCDRLEKDEES